MSTAEPRGEQEQASLGWFWAGGAPSCPQAALPTFPAVVAKSSGYTSGFYSGPSSAKATTGSYTSGFYAGSSGGSAAPVAAAPAAAPMISAPAVPAVVAQSNGYSSGFYSGELLASPPGRRSTFNALPRSHLTHHLPLSCHPYPRPEHGLAI